jgi:hypothetical protein
MFLEKLTVTQLVSKLLAFYGIRKFITALKKLATGPYPEPDESSPQHPKLFHSDPF